MAKKRRPSVETWFKIEAIRSDNGLNMPVCYIADYDVITQFLRVYGRGTDGQLLLALSAWNPMHSVNSGIITGVILRSPEPAISIQLALFDQRSAGGYAEKMKLSFAGMIREIDALDEIQRNRLDSRLLQPQFI